MDASELAERKQRLSPKLLGVAGVSGVGLGEGAVAVYLEADAEDLRERIRLLVQAESPGTPICFKVTGKFRARES